MKNYKVRDKVSKSKWVVKKADSPRDAAKSYCKTHGISSNVEVVDDFGNCYSFNLKKTTPNTPGKTTPNTPRKETSTASDVNFSSNAVTQKLDELIGVVKHIRLMFYVFVLVVLVVPYLISLLN